MTVRKGGNGASLPGTREGKSEKQRYSLINVSGATQVTKEDALKLMTAAIAYENFHSLTFVVH